MADLKYYDVILKPVVTEKSMTAMGEKKYTFYVNPDATKTQVKEAVEKGTDIISLKRLVAEVDQRKRVKDTNVGQTLLSEIADLEVLFEHYEEF